MIKAIFFDIDGTLLDHSPKGGGRIPPSTLRCLEALRKKGIKPVSYTHLTLPTTPYV